MGSRLIKNVFGGKSGLLLWSCFVVADVTVCNLCLCVCFWSCVCVLQVSAGFSSPGSALTQNPQCHGEHATGPRHAHHHQVRTHTHTHFKSHFACYCYICQYNCGKYYSKGNWVVLKMKYEVLQASHTHNLLFSPVCVCRNKETNRDEFIFYSKRLMRLLIEHALSFLPLKVSSCVVVCARE